MGNAFCENCGTKLSPGSKFCENCGTPVGNTQYTAPEEFKWRKTKDGAGVIIDTYTGKNPEVNIPPLIKGLPVVEINQMRVKTVTITSITIPNTIKTMASGFAGQGLTRVIISEGVTTIGKGAFNNSKNLCEVTIPDSVTTIEQDAFECCGLTNVTLGRGLTFIGKNAFAKNKLTEVSLPGGLSSIEKNAFYKNGLQKIIIPDSVTFLGESAFAGNKLKSANIPKGITFIARSVFFENPLTGIELHNRITTIENFAFCDCKLASLTIPDSVKYIGKQAFMNCPIKSVVIPDSLTCLEEGVFYWNQLRDVTVGRGVVRIGPMNFGDNYLTEVVIPPNVRYIDSSAFNLTDDGERAGRLKPKIVYSDPKAKPDDAAPPQYPARPEFLRELDKALHCSIASKSNTTEEIPNKTTPLKQDIFMCYTDGKLVREINPTGNIRWGYEFSTATVTCWKSSDAAKEAITAYQAKNPQKKITRIGRVTAAGDPKPLKRAASIMNMPKEEIIAAYTHIGVGAKRTSTTIREVKPAGNWLWEFEIENESYFGVIIGWASMADADIAEETYQSTPEIQHMRYGNATGMARGEENPAGCSTILSRFSNAARGMYSK